MVVTWHRIISVKQTLTVLLALLIAAAAPATGGGGGGSTDAHAIKIHLSAADAGRVAEFPRAAAQAAARRDVFTVTRGVGQAILKASASALNLRYPSTSSFQFSDSNTSGVGERLAGTNNTGEEWDSGVATGTSSVTGLSQTAKMMKPVAASPSQGKYAAMIGKGNNWIGTGNNWGGKPPVKRPGKGSPKNVGKGVGKAGVGLEIPSLSAGSSLQQSLLSSTGLSGTGPQSLFSTGPQSLSSTGPQSIMPYISGSKDRGRH